MANKRGNMIWLASYKPNNKMTIKIDTLKTISNLFNSKDTGCYAYTTDNNLVFIGSKDTFTGESLLSWDKFTDKQITKLNNAGVQYIESDSTWIISLFNLGKERSVELDSPVAKSSK